MLEDNAKDINVFTVCQRTELEDNTKYITVCQHTELEDRILLGVSATCSKRVRGWAIVVVNEDSPSYCDLWTWVLAMSSTRGHSVKYTGNWMTPLLF